MIDILSKIEQMRLKRNWSEYELSRRSGLPQTTINTWYRKQQIPTLPSLEKLSEAFGITLSELLADDNDPMEITSEDHHLLSHFHSLKPEQQKALLQLLETLTDPSPF
ncbi:MAG: helix-turn-helix transcriptional regulator [Lachnospiraceae bacterium]|nr:helix-turn-helix transcriptional regulator [Lachnospiraceae bacterium]